MKAFGIQSDCLTDFGTSVVSGEKIFADSDFICQLREPSLYQLHLAAGDIHHFAVAVHIGDVVPLPGMLLSQQIIFSHARKLRPLFQCRGIGCVNTGENRLISVSHLIPLNLCDRNRYHRRKADQKRRQCDSSHYHQVPALLTCKAFLRQFFHNGIRIILKRPYHDLPPPFRACLPLRGSGRSPHASVRRKGCSAYS